MKQQITYFLFILLAATSCNSTKKALGNSAKFKKISAKKVAKKHLENSFDKSSIEAKLKVAYKDNKNSQKLSVKLRVEKDKVIWMSVTATSLRITVARIKITPTSVSYYEKVNKTYYEGNFEGIKDILGIEVGFNQLQNLLLGQAIFDLNAEKYKAVVTTDAHLLLPVEQKALFDILFWINPNHFKLNGLEVKSIPKKQTLKVGYKEYTSIEGETFPKNIEIRARQKQKFTNIDIEYRSVIFNKQFTTPFKVPRGYKQVIF